MDRVEARQRLYDVMRRRFDNVTNDTEMWNLFFASMIMATRYMPVKIIIEWTDLLEKDTKKDDE